MTMRSVAIRSVSLVDLKKAVPFVRQMTIEEILDRTTDSVLQPFLHEMGMNINREIEWQACKHRTFDGEAVLDFRVVGEERTDPAWLCSKYCHIDTLIASQTDDSLKWEMLQASNEAAPAVGFFSPKGKKNQSDSLWPENQCEEDFEIVSTIIQKMRSKIKEVRGFVEE